MTRRFHPVVELPEEYDVLDLSGRDPTGGGKSRFSIGRYDEVRGIYSQPLFAGDEGGPRRTLHLGVDIGAPPGTPVHSFDEGEISYLRENSDDGDYGPTIVTLHRLDGAPIWALHGHLSRESLRGLRPGQKLARGEVFASIGGEHENGGWPPHLHFQLSRVDPGEADMRGVFDPADREAAMAIHPDPRLVLGPIY